MNKFIIVGIALLAVPFAFGVTNAAPVPFCGPQLDSCGGLESDGFYAGCNGAWRDLYQNGNYAQACVEDDGTAHVWACPNSFSYSVNSPACKHVATP